MHNVCANRLYFLLVQLLPKRNHSVRLAHSVMHDALPQAGIAQRGRVAQIRQYSAADRAITMTHAAVRVVVQLSLRNNTGTRGISRRLGWRIDVWWPGQ